MSGKESKLLKKIRSIIKEEIDISNSKAGIASIMTISSRKPAIESVAGFSNG